MQYFLQFWMGCSYSTPLKYIYIYIYIYIYMVYSVFFNAFVVSYIIVHHPN
ncbi:MAG: hypothetical protein N7Q72_02050 [Spiroplasma sp. Tabriz.8]|nr:hypothetical protein [Spiroplasma sp. Tabriz.8]